MVNHLYYGDNLEVLRKSIATESVDLIYLDPPFNSNASYNQLFKAPDGSGSVAQTEAFTDTWHWGDTANDAYGEVMRAGNGAAAEMLRAMRSFLGENDMMAYLAMMAVRLLELHRVLKPTGSLYLHCDPTASHYLKILLDAVFGVSNYGNEISWRRSNPKSLSSKNFANCRDIILRYTKSSNAFFVPIFGEHDPEYVEKAYRYRDARGKPYRLLPLLNPNDNRPNLTYEFLGVTRVWRWTRERMQKAYEDGLVVQLKKGAVPQYIKYLEDSQGRTISNDWNDINAIGAKEELGYPTQKPVALLERILSASSNPGDIVLDPFCGCGTSVHAAEKLDRQWIGIDVTHLAIGLIEKRLRDAFPAVQFVTHGVPQDIAGARDLANRGRADKNYYFEFEKWALSLINAMPGNLSKKGADRGIDGNIYFGKTDRAIVSVKAGDNVGVAMIRDLRGVIERENAAIGIFLTLTPPSQPMLTEAAAAGQFELADFAPVPRLQIVTVEQAMLLRDRALKLPMMRNDAFRRAKEEAKTGDQGQLEL